MTTRDRRASAAGVALSFLNQPPLPDGGLAFEDKQHVGYAYRGVSADSRPRERLLVGVGV